MSFFEIIFDELDSLVDQSGPCPIEFVPADIEIGSTVHLDITAVTHSIDFKQDPNCYSAKNLHPDFLKSFEALAMIDTDQVGNAAQWSPYVEFLKRKVNPRKAVSLFRSMCEG